MNTARSAHHRQRSDRARLAGLALDVLGALLAFVCGSTVAHAQPAKTAAQNFAKLPARPQSATEQMIAIPMSASTATTSQRRFHSGSATQTSRSVPGMIASATSTTDGHTPIRGRCGATPTTG